MTYKLILLRHGESEWNALNLFTGWVDVDLTEKGVAEAKRGGELLAEQDDNALHKPLTQTEAAWATCAAQVDSLIACQQRHQNGREHGKAKTDP